MSDKIIVDMLKEVREDQKGHTILLTELRKDVEQNTKDIANHVVIDKKEHELFKLELSDISKDVEKFKDDKRALRKIKKWIIGLGALAGAVLGILKFLSFIGYIKF